MKTVSKRSPQVSMKTVSKRSPQVSMKTVSKTSQYERSVNGQYEDVKRLLTSQYEDGQ